jgi:hypothetical protein
MVGHSPTSPESNLHAIGRIIIIRAFERPRLDTPKLYLLVNTHRVKYLAVYHVAALLSKVSATTLVA